MCAIQCCCLRFYNDALTAACDESLLGLFVMLVSSVLSAVIFTVLVWCHFSSWSHFKHNKVGDTNEKSHKIFQKGKDLSSQIKFFTAYDNAIKEEFGKLKDGKKLERSKSSVDKESIHASSISFPELMHSFIVTKVPTSGSMINFWRMINEKRVKTIIMLASLENNYINFKAEYLPTKENIILDLTNGLSLELKDTSFHEFYEKR